MGGDLASSEEAVDFDRGEGAHDLVLLGLVVPDLLFRFAEAALGDDGEGGLLLKVFFGDEADFIRRDFGEGFFGVDFEGIGDVEGGGRLRSLGEEVLVGFNEGDHFGARHFDGLVLEEEGGLAHA